MTPWLAHRANPLHVYCRMRDLHVGRRQAAWAARIYETLYHWICRQVNS